MNAPRLVLRSVDVSNRLVAETIAAMDEECFGPDEGRYVPPEGHWWIATVDGKEAGYAGMKPSVRWERTGYMCRAGVLAPFRGQGLQKRLIRARLAKARSLGWTTVLTDTRQNPVSSNSLIACGFRMYTPEYPWGFHDACYWRKVL